MRAMFGLGCLAATVACSSETGDGSSRGSSPSQPSSPEFAMPAPGAAASPPGVAASPPSVAEQPPLAGFDTELDPLGDVTGDDDACLTQTEEAEQLGLDILLMLDSSGSMAQPLPSDLAAT